MLPSAVRGSEGLFWAGAGGGFGGSAGAGEDRVDSLSAAGMSEFCGCARQSVSLVVGLVERACKDRCSESLDGNMDR